MGAMDARNMYSNLAVNKYLHTFASSWISSTSNFDHGTTNIKFPGNKFRPELFWNFGMPCCTINVNIYRVIPFHSTIKYVFKITREM